MANEFKKIYENKFKRSVNIRKVPKKESYVIQTSINSLWQTIKEWQKYFIPKNITKSNELLGGYLAGIIDGDGHIKLKSKNKSRVIQQCVIRITFDHENIKLKEIIEEKLKCKVHFEYSKSKATDLCFYVSSKNIKWIEKYLIKEIKITKKRLKLNDYIKIKKASLLGFEPRLPGIFSKWNRSQAHCPGYAIGP